MTETNEGGCLCGTVRYVVIGLPLRTTFCMCKFCQKMTGTPMNRLTNFHAENFEVLTGDLRTYEHISEGSGKAINLHSCRTCSSTVFMTLERFPGFVGVVDGTLDDPDWIPNEPDNTKYIFANSAQQGTIVPAGYPVFAEHATTLDGQPCAPEIFDHHHTLCNPADTNA